MKFFPKSADGFLSAMMMAENALLRDFSLRRGRACVRQSPRFLW